MITIEGGKMVILDKRKVITGFPNGEKKAEEIYENIQNIEIIDEIIYKVEVAESVGLSFVEGFVFCLKDKENGSELMGKLKIEGTARVVTRFGRYL